MNVSKVNDTSKGKDPKGKNCVVIKAHTRKTKSGKVVNVKEQTRCKKAGKNPVILSERAKGIVKKLRNPKKIKELEGKLKEENALVAKLQKGEKENVDFRKGQVSRLEKAIQSRGQTKDILDFAKGKSDKILDFDISTF